MDKKEIDKAERICIRHLGYVPTEEEWLAVGMEEPGLLSLWVSVLNKSFADRHIKQELYDYSKKPTAKQLHNDPDTKAIWDKEKRKPC